MAGFSGDGSAAVGASLNNPSAVALDPNGNILIADRDNHRIRRIDSGTGIISTVAGTGAPGFSGDVERALRSIKVPLLYMPSETDLYFPIGDARYEAAFIQAAGANVFKTLKCYVTFGGLPPDKLEGKGNRLVFGDKTYDATEAVQTIVIARDGTTRLEAPK